MVVSAVVISLVGARDVDSRVTVLVDPVMSVLVTSESTPVVSEGLAVGSTVDGILSELSRDWVNSVSVGKRSNVVDWSISVVSSVGKRGGNEILEAGIVVMKSVAGRLIVEGKSSEDAVGTSGNASDDELLVNRKELVCMGFGWIASSDEGFKVGKLTADVRSGFDVKA